MLFAFAIIGLIVAGYGGIYVLGVGVFSSAQNAASYAVLTLFLTFIILALPYGLLKLVGYAAHARNPRERIPTLKDLPKDQDQLNKSRP
jgi:hypothetical protein